MRQSSISLISKGATLEGVIASPQGVAGSLPGVIVCHPHPLFGGNMDNNLILTICQALAGQGYVTLRFNFRGIGNSEGSFTNGEKEHEDVRAALDLLRQWPGVNRRRLGLAGYSFGASMVLAGLHTYKAAKAFVLISPPLAALERPKVVKDTRPKLFIIGDKDRLVPHSSLKEKIDSLGRTEQRSMDSRATTVLVAGADHSWRGHEAEAARQAAQFFGSKM